MKNKEIFKNANYAGFYDEAGNFVIEISKKDAVNIAPKSLIAETLTLSNEQKTEKMKEWIKEVSGADVVIIS